MKLSRDTWLIFQRQVLIMCRTPVWILVGILQPVCYLLLFAPLLRAALVTEGAQSQADAYRVYVPGLLTALALMGGLFTGFSLLGELRAGIIERSRVTPVSRAALLLGRALREVVALLVQALLVTLLALPFGLSVSPAHLVLAFLLLGLIVLMASSVSYGLALLIGDDAALGPVVNTLAQPLALLSGTLLPIALGPRWLRTAAEWNPLYWAVEGMRALFRGDAGAPAVFNGLLLTSGLAALAVAWSARLFAVRIR
ncbi:ABC transporter permease [Streptomyces pluripotens]|uniref:Transport permease protein n=1 Tax=Streptomyces pluripotens TaxID=1355015 RepID=A0A221P6V3_9ACTN|nr:MULTISPECIES: ABC transporter permease [Streptomyces]ARP73753.1 multidrug ABC transporter permease [Streptomyces pluripotens]ASN27999.1 ABC transporter permease [Streptomyces pluripotens]KIE27913.1 multidrug ABC transporter permease [Streptomyces sp. MUSC 125]MCH0559326.1 ABC transporter permease [Streptomyces sp. MUM 16J]